LPIDATGPIKNQRTLDSNQVLPVRGEIIRKYRCAPTSRNLPFVDKNRQSDSVSTPLPLIPLELSGKPNVIHRLAKLNEDFTKRSLRQLSSREELNLNLAWYRECSPLHHFGLLSIISLIVVFRYRDFATVPSNHHILEDASRSTNTFPGGIEPPVFVVYPLSTGKIF